MIQPHNRHMSISFYIAALAMTDTIALLLGKGQMYLFLPTIYVSVILFKGSGRVHSVHVLSGQVLSGPCMVGRKRGEGVRGSGQRKGREGEGQGYTHLLRQDGDKLLGHLCI